MKKQFILLLFGASVFFAQGQERTDTKTPAEESKVILSPDQELLTEVEALKREFKGDISIEIADVSREAKALKKGEEAVQHSESAEYLIKQLLGDVYAEVGHIPESQWFEMEPVAETYIRTFFEARAMSDGNAATRLMAEARKTFEAAIDAKLTREQKSVREQKRAAQKVWLQQVEAQYQAAIDFAIRESGRTGNNDLSREKSDTSGLKGDSNESVKSFQITFK